MIRFFWTSTHNRTWKKQNKNKFVSLKNLKILNVLLLYINVYRKHQDGSIVWFFHGH